MRDFEISDSNKEKIYTWIEETLGVFLHNKELSEEEITAKLAIQKQKFSFFVEEEKEMAIIMLTEVLSERDLVLFCSFYIRFVQTEELTLLLFMILNNMELEPDEAIMVKFQLDSFVKGYEEEKKSFLKKVRNILIRRLGINYSYTPVDKRQKKRVVLLTNQMISLNHAPTKVVFDYAYVLKKMDYEILVFSCVCNGDAITELWYEPVRINHDIKFEKEKWVREYNGETFEGYQICMSDDYLKDYGMMLDIIYYFQPLFVMCIGINNPISECISQFTDTVFKGVTTEFPITESSIITVPSKTKRIEKKDDGQVVCEVGKIRTAFQTHKKRDFTREEFGLTKDKFLVAIVGNRLEKEIDDKLLEVLKTIHEKRKNIEYVIIGNVSESFLSDVGCVIHKIGYCSDLIGAMRLFDLYLNPFRIGGGYSAAISLCAGVPVVTLPECDVAYHVGNSFIVQNADEMIERVVEYNDNRQFYKEQAIKANQFAEEHTFENYYKDIKEHMETIESIVFDVSRQREGKENKNGE